MKKWYCHYMTIWRSWTIGIDVVGIRPDLLIVIFLGPVRFYVGCDNEGS